MGEPWERPEIQRWCRLLLNSYYRWVGRELIEPAGRAEDQARALFHAPFVVVSHGMEDDPVLNFGNQVALELWETTWDHLTTIPSRLTAEPINQAERAKMLEKAAAKGFIDDYRGVRISTKGRRFLVEQAIVWNVVNENSDHLGQAAMFSRWKFLGD